MTPTTPTTHETTLAPGGAAIGARAVVPHDARGLVVFAQDHDLPGTGDARLAQALRARGIATLVLDPLDPDAGPAPSDDVDRLAARLMRVVDALGDWPPVSALPLGCLGAGAGAAAALIAAAERPGAVAAVVSLAGRPELARPWLPSVEAPTLLVVGGADPDGLEHHRAARARLAGPTQLRVVHATAPRLDEPGAFDEAERAAVDWFAEHLAAAAGATRRPLGDPAC